MREIPILFSGAMVRAILERGKSQTRRLINAGRPTERDRRGGIAAARPGDRLWVRETWYFCPRRSEFLYRADRPEPKQPPAVLLGVAAKWRPSIFMPREACRVELEVVATRVEHVQAMTEADAIAEGIYEITPGRWCWADARPTRPDPVAAYARLWDEINPDDPWRTNPIVAVVTFGRREVDRA